jgi:hypothetical protein
VGSAQVSRSQYLKPTVNVCHPHVLRAYEPRGACDPAIADSRLGRRQIAIHVPPDGEKRLRSLPLEARHGIGAEQAANDAGADLGNTVWKRQEELARCHLVVGKTLDKRRGAIFLRKRDLSDR